jgi:AraC-like DNA-binding protein
MSWHELELMARGGTLALLALWCWLLWRDHRDMLAARTAIAMNIGIASYVFVTSGWTERQDLAGLIIPLLARSTPGLFWLFAKTWFNDRAKLAPADVILVAASMVNALVVHFTFESRTPAFYVSGALFRISMLGFGIAGLWEAWRGRDDDLIEARRRLRLGVVGAVGLYVLVIGFAEIAVYQANAPFSVIGMIGSSTAFITLALCAAMFASRKADLFGAPAEASAMNTQRTNDDAQLAARLQAMMDMDKPHRDERLTIAALAQQLGIQEYRLRRLINGSLGHRNFAQFLNGYRLAEVKQALSDPAQREVPILTIALDAGFGSLGPFNRAFREAEGVTPTAFRNRHAG